MLLAGTAVLVAAAAQAQQAPVPSAPAASDNMSAAKSPPVDPSGAEIVVTGSRLPSTSLTSSAPVNVLNSAQIKATGATNVRELLRVLPAATATTGESAGRGNSGTATVALRGLSAVNTLVLINGRRVLANSAGGTVDLNSIPFAAIDRVEVLQDGASAIYGSDAIAGVVNLITKQSYDGLLLNAYYGISSRGDLPTRQFDATFGHSWDRGGFVISGSYRKADGNHIADRPISRDVDWRDRGGRNFRDPLPIVSAFAGINPADPNAQYIIKSGVKQVTSTADLRPFVFPDTDTPLSSGNDGINFWQYETSSDDIDTANVYFNGHYDVTSGITAYVEASYNHRHSLGYLAPDYIGAVYGNPVIVAADNIYNPFGQALSVARSFTEEPIRDRRQNDVHDNTYRIIAGLKGDLFGNWKWDASYNYQHLDEYSFLGHGIVYSKIQEAAGGPATCNHAVDGCVPINLFGGVGSVTPEMLDFVTADSSSNASSSLKSAVVNASGSLFDLPAGPVNLAIGGEYREETYSLSFDELSQQNAFVGRTLEPNASPPARKIGEVYAELGVPILKDLPLIRSLDVEAAVRYSHYNAFGGTTNPKIGIKWRPIHDLLIRGTWGTGFRAPTFTEAYGGQTNGFQPIIDPCIGANYANYPGCGGHQVVSTSTGAFVLTGGNPNLKPETAKNLTVGLVYTPSFLPGLAFTVDYYRIKKSNIIGSPNVNFIIEQNALNGSFPGAVVRGSDGVIADVVALRDNLLTEEIKGIDAEVVYATGMHSWGKLNLQGNLTYLDSFKLPPAPGVAAVERVGTYEQQYGTLARFRANALITWTLDKFSVSYNGRFVGAVRNEDGLQDSAGRYPRAKSYIQHDLQFNVNIDPGDMTFTLGVRNILDRMPPFLEGNYANGFDQTTFDSIGRYFYTSVQKKF
jgi:iron complex outermembrane receptor protein